LERFEKAAERERIREERAKADAEERAVAEWFGAIQSVADAAMITAGFHLHRRHLAGIRDDAELAKLPEPERVAFRKLWADVDALLRKASRP
jgi:hypothetical protein